MSQFTSSRAPERVIPFHFHTHTLRADLTEAGTPIFHAGDLCALLGYKNPRAAIRRHVDQEDVAKRDTLTDGGIQAELIAARAWTEGSRRLRAAWSDNLGDTAEGGVA